MAQRWTYIKLRTIEDDRCFFNKGDILDGRKRNGFYEVLCGKATWLVLEPVDDRDGVFEVELCVMPERYPCIEVYLEEVK